MEERKAAKLNANILAYIGDAIYDLHIREKIVAKGTSDVSKAHRIAIRYVSCDGQSYAARQLMKSGFLTEDEIVILKRARNHRTMSRPKNADPRDYKVATGFEALIGYLHLTGSDDRVREIVDEAVRLVEEKNNLTLTYRL